MNIEQLEDDLRAALATRADEVPARAGARVRAHGYRPRTRSVRPPVAAGAITAAAAAGAAVGLLALTADTPSAFAGWSATPTRGAHRQVTGAEATCRQRLAQHVPPPRAPTPRRSPSIAVGHLAPVLTDTRGPFTWVIFASDHGSASCISGPSFTALSGSVSSRPQTAPAGQVALSSSSQTTTPDGNGYSFTEGRVGAGVTAVTLVLDDGTPVQTTVQGDWFVAWWPGDHAAASARVTTSAGTTTQTLPSRSGTGCPQPKPGSGGARMCMSGTAVGRGAGHASSAVVSSSRGG
jgi:hypothetical protein